MTQKPRQVVHPITKISVWSAYPLTREEAVAENIVKYWPTTPCPTHGGQPVAYMLTGILACCANHDAAAAYNDARLTGGPTSLSEARTQGLDYYWTPQPHPRCGHVGKATLDGKCWVCREGKRLSAPSPRQQAIAAGETWYMPAPDNPCPNGHVSKRRVANGSCSTCEEEARNFIEKVRPECINKTCPDMLISRNDARTMGFKVFRTGDPCHVGHTGWRYVSTGCCIDCKTGVPPVVKEG